MPSKSLLRHIFRHGPHTRPNKFHPPTLTTEPTAPLDPQVSIPSVSQTSFLRPSSRTSSSLDDILEEPHHHNASPQSSQYSNTSTSAISTADSPLAYRSRPLQSLSSILNNDSQDNFTPSSASEDDGDDNIHLPCSNRNEPSPSPFPIQAIITATLHEAKAAHAAHMETLDTVLALLDALEGFSATVSVLRGEMSSKRRECEGRLEVVREVEGEFLGEGGKEEVER